MSRHVKRDPETVRAAIDGLREIMGDDPAQAPALHTLTTFGRGEIDHVRVFAIPREWHLTDSRPRILELTWHLSCVLESPNLPHRGVPFGGGQYSKGLEAADHLWRAVYGREVPFPQMSHWYEL